MFFGDSGKGSIIDYLARKLENPIVVRYSGAHQCGHNVHTSDGKTHCFSQFGAGTLAGVPTYIDRDVIIEPFALLREAEHLKSLGIDEPFKMLFINPNCSITTQYHKIVNRAIQKENGVGSCGLGVGMTRYTDLCGESIKLSDSLSGVIKKLFNIRAILEDYYYVKCGYRTPLNFDNVNVYKLGELLDKSLNTIFNYEINNCSILNYNNLIFEGAQGILLNEYTGLNPKESTWGNVTPRNAIELCDYYNIKYKTLGIMRTYLTRHGGNLPEPELNMTDEGNPYNDYQGNMKFYNITNSYINKSISMFNPDYVAVTCLDQIDQDFNLPIAIRSYGKTAKDKHLVDERILN